MALAYGSALLLITIAPRVLHLLNQFERLIVDGADKDLATSGF